MKKNIFLILFSFVFLLGCSGIQQKNTAVNKDDPKYILEQRREEYFSKIEKEKKLKEEAARQAAQRKAEQQAQEARRAEKLKAEIKRVEPVPQAKQVAPTVAPTYEERSAELLKEIKSELK